MRDVKDYLILQGRFSHLSDVQIDKIRSYISEKWRRIVDMRGDRHAVTAEFFV